MVSRDAMDVYARKVCFLPASGKAMVKRLATTNSDALAAQALAAAQKSQPTASGGGSIDLVQGGTQAWPRYEWWRWTIRR